MRLIDAKAFDLRVSQKKMTEVFPNWIELPVEVQDAVCKHAQYLHMLLETQHTVDAVEVVRCADCVLEGTENCPMVHRDPILGNLYCTFPANGGYCSKGVRRKDET